MKKQETVVVENMERQKWENIRKRLAAYDEKWKEKENAGKNREF